VNSLRRLWAGWCPVFGQIKQARGFRQFLLRGVEKVRAEWAMICTGFLSIAMMRAYLVSRPAAGRGDAAADRLRDAGLAILRAVERVAAFGFDLGLVMGTSEVCATPSAAPPQPHLANHRAGRDPGDWLEPFPSHHSNAPIEPECQSIPSNIIAPFQSPFSLKMRLIILQLVIAAQRTSRRANSCLLMGSNQGIFSGTCASDSGKVCPMRRLPKADQQTDCGR
jgi:hypothetical protein